MEKSLGSGSSLASIRSAGSGGETFSLSEQIAVQLAEMIVRGEFEPGARVHEVAVSERFKVSRGPVREALRILERDGLITILPRRGAVVTKLTIEEVCDIFEIRAVLIGLAARRVALQRDPEVAREMRKRVDVLEEIARGDTSSIPDAAYVAAVQELNLFFSAASGSARLSSMIYSLFHQTLRYSQLGLSTPERRLQSLASWKNIVKYIQNGQADEAEATAKRLVEESKTQAMKMLAKDSNAAGA